MVRNYVRKFTNTRNGKNHAPYLSYSNEDIQKAIADIENGTLKLKDAAAKYNIPKSTLSRRLRKINCTQPKAGHPTLFSNEEELVFLEYITLMSAWGFPVDSTDLRIFGQRYLNKMGKTLHNLTDNLPGVDWARNFITRHRSQISNRQATNISSERAKISPNVIDDFFSYYKNTVEGVSPDCLINYDETNLTDDPGNKKYLFKRGCKYPERIINSTKTSVSLMFSGTADGQLLPIYVVYKAENLWDQWLEGGPPGTRYNRSKSGWFDSICFEDWFNTIIVPYVKTKRGQKVVLIGDNLSSHFSASVLETCKKLNIIFVCLPPKTTHLLQPLDVAFFAPLKKYWRDVLTTWKKTDGLQHKTLVKSSFPMLLCRLKNKLTENGSESTNIIAGFNKCGLYPVCSARPKSRLPQINSISEEHIQKSASAAVIEILKEIRNPSANLVGEQPKRKKKCDVPPGKSITAEDLQIELTQKNTKKSQQNKSKKSILLSKKRDRSSSTDSDMTRHIVGKKENHLSQPIAGPSGLCRKKKKTTANMRNVDRDNEFDTLQDKYKINKSEIKTGKTLISTYKGKGKGKKSKVKTQNNNIDKDHLDINSRRNVTSTVANLIRKKKIKKSSDYSTSVSDIMSVHSDSDLVDVDFGKDSSDVQDDNSYVYSERKALPCTTEVENNFDDQENERREQDCSLPLVFFNDNIEDVIIGEDNNAITLIPFNEAILYNKENIERRDIESKKVIDSIGEEDKIKNKNNNPVTLIPFNEAILYNKENFETRDIESKKVIDSIEEEDKIENKEYNIETAKRVTILKEERLESILVVPQKKKFLKNLKPIDLNQPFITRKIKKNYYNNSQEIMKALLDSDQE